MKIGYIGLGLMGIPCTRNLLKAGYSVCVWARHKTKALPVLEQGATWCNSIIEVAKASDILFTNLSDTPDVQEVLLGESGVIKSQNQGLIVVDMSTISASATRDMAKQLSVHNIELVDAPVSGGTVGANEGTLTIMVGASESTFTKIQPILSCMGKNITRIGECGSGQVAKSCNQIIITGTIAAVAEALTFATASDVDFHPIREALLGGFASSRVLDLHATRMMDDNYTPGFKTALHVKDMGIVQSIAKELNLDLPVTKTSVSLLKQANEAGSAEEDSSAMAKIILKQLKE